MPPPCPYPTIPSPCLYPVPYTQYTTPNTQYPYPLPYIRFNSVALHSNTFHYIALHDIAIITMTYIAFYIGSEIVLGSFFPVLFFFLGFPVLSIFLALYRILEVEAVFATFLSSNLPFSMEFATFWCYCSIWSWMLQFQRYLQHV